MEFSMMDVAPTVSAILGLPAPSGARGTAIRQIAEGLAGSERVALLAPDALGLFAWNLWKDEMPYLGSLHAAGSVVLRSVMPSITPVNFATMITGTDLDGHGIHTFEHDFACETLFDVVRRAGGASAGVGLDGYTGSKLLARFADIDGNAGCGTDEAVADKVVEIAGGKRPRFLIAQLGRVDDVFHQFGPSSPEVVPMLRETDGRLKRLVDCLKPLGYGVIILADHGQHDVTDEPESSKRGNHGTDSSEDCLVPCTWV